MDIFTKLDLELKHMDWSINASTEKEKATLLIIYIYCLRYFLCKNAQKLSVSSASIYI